MFNKLNSTLDAAYDEQYSGELSEWRELGGKYKARNIVEMCQAHTFRKVLECGAGEGALLEYLDRANIFDELYAIEIAEGGIDGIRKRNLVHLREVLKFDGYRIPYPDKSFDMAYCSHVMEHVEHGRILLRELRRISGFQIFEIPLDYSMDVDRHAQHFLSYGQINIYTPSLFKFLLKTEGFEILDEKFSRITPEVVRYNWYHNMKLKKSIRREFMLKLDPFFQLLRRIRRGRAWYQEFGFSAYTCLTRGVGELKIFDDPIHHPTDSL